MEEAKPVVLTKPVRGREMLSKKGPLGKVAPVGKVIEPEKVDKKRVETYYEGYVDGQLFLVPDSNLEAMKDMINFKMRPKTSIRYKHQTSYDIQYYDQFTEKLNELLSKIDDFQESGDFERIKPIERESTEESTEENSEDREKTEPGVEIKDIIPSEEKMEKEVTTSKEKIEKGSVKSSESVRSKIHQVKSEIIEELKKEYVLEDSSTSSSSSSQTSKLPEKLDEPEKVIANQIYEETETDEHRVRFLISGHFKDGENPLYIVQEYDGKNNIFKDQKLDFKSFQENSMANVFISGKLYTENILEESEGKPLFLNTKPEKITINEEKSKTFNDSFEHVFEKEDYRILLQGKFIKGKNNQITPSLSFSVKEKYTSSNSDKEESLQKQ